MGTKQQQQHDDKDVPTTLNSPESVKTQNTLQELATFGITEESSMNTSVLEEHTKERMSTISSQPCQVSCNSCCVEQRYLPSLHTEGKRSESKYTRRKDLPVYRQSGGILLLLPRCRHGHNLNIRNLLHDSPLRPPIRKDTLSELDLVSIQNNINLRIDLNFDFDLYFQPISGTKGQRKQCEIRDYFRCIAIELEYYRHQNEFQGRDCLDCAKIDDAIPDLYFQPRLETMFVELKELLEASVPKTNHEEVANYLEVSFLMDQVYKGALDILRLTNWIHDLLTMHCAPIRDELADEMRSDLENAVANNSMSLLVEGLSKLFCLCESMKLDVVNHQVRTFRSPLVRDTVPFQIDCFTKLKQNSQIELTRSKIWFNTEYNRLRRDRTDLPKPSPFECFIDATSRLCGDMACQIPDTFHYDKQRFKKLQSDLLQLVQLRICIGVFDFILLQHRVSYDRKTCHHHLSSRIMQIVEDDENETILIGNYLDEVSYEIARAAFEIAKRSGKLEPFPHAMPDSYIKQVNTSLGSAFDREKRNQSFMQQALNTIRRLAWEQAIHFSSLSTLEMSNEQRQWMQDQNSIGVCQILPSLEDLARRIAHIGTLNWRVWSDLVYLDNNIGMAELDLQA